MPKSKCKICQKEFYVKPSHQERGWGKYCSMKCRAKGQETGKESACEICGKLVWKTPGDFKKSKSKKFFCSKSCQTIWRNQIYSGSNHYLWRGGAGTYRDRMKKSGKEAVCQKCGNDDLRVLAVHHKDFSRKNNSLDNLVWLCRNCHCLVHIIEEKI